MLKKSVWWLLPAMFVLSPGIAAAEVKIAVLDQLQAVFASDEAKAALDRIQKEVEPEATSIKALEDEITALRSRLQKDGEVISEPERRRIEKEIEDKSLDYQFRGKKLQKEAQDKQQEVLAQMRPKLQAVLKDVIDLEGYDMIVPVQAVLYTNPKHDITRRVTEKLNEKRAEKPAP